MKKVQPNKKVVSIEQLKIWFEGSSDTVIKTRDYQDHTLDFCIVLN